MLGGMALAISVPLNTMLADLDESLRGLLKRELGRHGFDGVDVVFDAPTKEWAAGLSSPTVDLFLYDLQEATDKADPEWSEQRSNGEAIESRPPLRVDASYAVTAWTREVEDEHRLLSQILAVLYAYQTLPDDALTGRLANGTQPFPLETEVAQRKGEDKSDFWTSIGGQYKASIDYVVTVACPSGTTMQRGPEVRTQTLRLRDSAGGPRTIEELHRVGGVVRDADGEPVANAWVVLSDAGIWAASGPEGRFRFDRLRAGEYHVVARTADGREAEAALTVPGSKLELEVGKAKAPARKRKA
jgi:Pvc16 N-terminal domain/Carboxypeptidase regulatory-like domain